MDNLGKIDKHDISDRWPTITPQFTSVGPIIVCCMGYEAMHYIYIYYNVVKYGLSKNNSKAFN